MLDKTLWHRLTQRDVENRTAICSRCGPVALRQTGPRGFACINAARNAVRESNHRHHGFRAVLPYFHSREQQNKWIRRAKRRGCQICGRKVTPRLHFDHDHKTGKFRGLLCGRCNFGIGHFKDDVELLMSAIQYLEKTRAKV